LLAGEVRLHQETHRIVEVSTTNGKCPDEHTNARQEDRRLADRDRRGWEPRRDRDRCRFPLHRDEHHLDDRRNVVLDIDLVRRSVRPHRSVGRIVDTLFLRRLDGILPRKHLRHLLQPAADYDRAAEPGRAEQWSLFRFVSLAQRDSTGRSGARSHP